MKKLQLLGLGFLLLAANPVFSRAVPGGSAGGALRVDLGDLGDQPETGGVPSWTESSLPGEVYDGYLLVVTGRIGRIENLHFAIDTGATNTVIDRRIADSLGLGRYSAEALTVGRSAKIEFANLPEIQFGSLRASHLPVAVSNLSFFRSFATRVDAIIGMDLLGRQNFTLDYAGRRLILGSARAARYEAPLRVGPLLAVELSAQNHPLEMIVDSGASGIILYQERLQRRSILYGGQVRARGMAFSGMTYGTIASLPQLHLAGASIEPRVFVAEDPVVVPEAVPDRDGYLGLAALNAKFVSFDFCAGKMSWSN